MINYLIKEIKDLRKLHKSRTDEIDEKVIDV